MFCRCQALQIVTMDVAPGYCWCWPDWELSVGRLSSRFIAGDNVATISDNNLMIAFECLQAVGLARVTRNLFNDV